MNDFLDNLGAHQYQKMRERNAREEEITNTCEETYGKKNCHEETYYNSESEGKDIKETFYAPEEWGIWQTSKYGEEYDEEFWKEYNAQGEKTSSAEESNSKNFWDKIVSHYKKIFDKETNAQEETYY